MKFDLEDCKQFADRHRGKYVTSGPHWSLVMRFPRLYDYAAELEAALDEAISRAETAEATLQAATDFHPRAMKLIRKRKSFLVVANDEPYYRQVYDLIRDHEILAGTWTPSDQMRYENALAALKDGEE